MKKKIRNILLLSALVFCLCLLGACGAQGGGDGDPTPSGGAEAAGTVTPFVTEDLYGTAYTEALFSECDLTMVNLFTTWCPSCQEEMPDLERLNGELSDRNAQVIGVVLDTMDDPDGEVLAAAAELAESTGVTYPLLVCTEDLMPDVVASAEYVPTTVFVDRDGNLVGEIIVGAHSLDEWRDIVDGVLAGLQEA